MRVRAVALVAGVAVGLGLAGCSGGASGAGAAGGAPAAAASAPPRLTDRLVTAARLPAGFQLLASDASRTSAPGAPIASMPCTELTVSRLLQRHTRPLEEASVGLEQPPADPENPDDNGWFGQESLDRYGPGQAAEAMAAVRDAAQRCPAYTEDFPNGDSARNALSTKGAGVPADDSVVLRETSTFVGKSTVWITEKAFVREGDVIMTMEQIVDDKPRFGVEAVLPAAVAAYRAAGGGAG
ncbi:hypothetical protein ACFVXG_44345 [Kitasatospora sp. NPDC058162]|uniref:hypothetical protein n=1 Tax=Kitasatospora sp. NPDC058162 TaxID=3346362 RepID=UPI0036DC6501